MANNVRIETADGEFNEQVDALRVPKSGGGSEDWVTAAGKDLVKLTVGERGTYKAEDYGVYGISEVTVRKGASLAVTPDRREGDIHDTAIAVGGRPRAMAARTLLVPDEEGECGEWAAKKDVRLTKSYAYKDGVYNAAGEQAYGYSQFNVLFSPDGRDPIDGRETDTIPPEAPGEYTDEAGLNVLLVWQSTPILTTRLASVKPIEEYPPVYYDPIYPLDRAGNAFTPEEIAKLKGCTASAYIYGILRLATHYPDYDFSWGTGNGGLLYYMTRVVNPYGKTVVWLIPYDSGQQIDTRYSVFYPYCYITAPGTTYSDTKPYDIDVGGRMEFGGLNHLYQSSFSSEVYSLGQLADSYVARAVEWVPLSDYDHALEYFRRGYIQEQCHGTGHTTVVVPTYPESEANP